MKTQSLGTTYVPQPSASWLPAAAETVKALIGRVDNLHSRCLRRLGLDCEVRTQSDRWYLRAMTAASIGMAFPPLLIVTAVCVYKAKKCREGGEV